MLNMALRLGKGTATQWMSAKQTDRRRRSRQGLHPARWPVSAALQSKSSIGLYQPDPLRRKQTTHTRQKFTNRLPRMRCCLERQWRLLCNYTKTLLHHQRYSGTKIGCFHFSHRTFFGFQYCPCDFTLQRRNRVDQN